MNAGRFNSGDGGPAASHAAPSGAMLRRRSSVLGGFPNISDDEKRRKHFAQMAEFQQKENRKSQFINESLSDQVHGIAIPYGRAR